MNWIKRFNKILEGSIGPESCDANNSYWHGDGKLYEDMIDESLIMEALTPEEKMDAWYEGRRRENIARCGDEKLEMYLTICIDKGYTDCVRTIYREMSNRGYEAIARSCISNSPAMYRSIFGQDVPTRQEHRVQPAQPESAQESNFGFDFDDNDEWGDTGCVSSFNNLQPGDFVYIYVGRYEKCYELLVRAIHSKNDQIDIDPNNQWGRDRGWLAENVLVDSRDFDKSVSFSLWSNEGATGCNEFDLRNAVLEKFHKDINDCMVRWQR